MGDGNYFWSYPTQRINNYKRTLYPTKLHSLSFSHLVVSLISILRRSIFSKEVQGQYKGKGKVIQGYPDESMCWVLHDDVWLNTDVHMTHHTLCLPSITLLGALSFLEKISYYSYFFVTLINKADCVLSWIFFK